MSDEFTTQLELEALEKQRQLEGDWEGYAPDPYSYVDPNDGTVYQWDSQKQAWFPKVDDDFIASYQSTYGCYSADSGNAQTVLPPPTSTQCLLRIAEKRKPNNEPGWFEVDDAHNTNVYVSGLPPDINEEEFVQLMSKCGLVMKDPDSGKFKVKLYKNPDGTMKGDGRCCYIKVESVHLAENILDGYRYKDCELHVEQAKFQLKGQYDPSKKPKKRKAKEKEKLKKKLDKLFDWRPDKLRGMRLKCEKTVIIKNMFDPKEFEKDVTLILEYQNDVREECSKCGEVKKVVVYDRHPEGIIAVTFKEVEMADECIELMNGRWFAGRQLAAETWDGRTKYKISETEAERSERLSEWNNFLEGGDGNKKSDEKK